jgi:hypothetical protein
MRAKLLVTSDATTRLILDFRSSSALIHKSPEVSHRQDGSVITRLCLKVDADDYDGSEWGLINPGW